MAPKSIKADRPRKAATADSENIEVVVTDDLVKPKPLQESNANDALEEMMHKLKMMSIQKDRAEMLLKEKNAELELRNAEQQKLKSILDSKDQEQKRLEEKVRKLQKMKEFHPSLSIPIAEDAKKNKDANKMKRPKNPFMLFCKEYRQQVKEEHPTAHVGEMSSLLSEKWKGLSEEERSPYNEQYKLEKEVYLKVVDKEKREAEAVKLLHEEQNKKIATELLEQYLAYKDAQLGGKLKKKSKNPSEPDRPKKPMAAFFAFSNEQRPSLLAQKVKPTEIQKQLGDQWNNMNEEARAPYEKVASEDKLRYAKELEAYALQKAEIGKELDEQNKVEQKQGMHLLKQKERIDQAKKTLKDERLQKKKIKDALADPNRPRKPATSYLLFTVENRKRIQKEKPNANFGEITATLAVRWQELSEEEKKPWTEKAAIAREKYKSDMLVYSSTKASIPQ